MQMGHPPTVPLNFGGNIVAIEFEWYVEGQVALATLSDVVDTRDLATGNEIISQWMQATDAEMFHVIFDASAMTRITFSARETMRVLQYLKHPRMGGFIVFGVPSYLQPMVMFMGTILNQLSRAQFFSVQTLDSALSLIRQIDPALADLRSNHETNA